MNFEANDDSKLNAVGKLKHSGSGDVVLGDKNVQTVRPAALATIIDEGVPPLTAWQTRSEEATIAKWLAQPHIRLVGIYGAGGFGKSALAAKVYGDATGFDRKLWANFQTPAAFGTFALWLIRQAMGDRKYEAARELYERQSDADLQRQALNLWAQKRWLLVMDNVETLLAEPMGQLYEQFWAAWWQRQGGSVLVLTTQQKVDRRVAEQREWLTLAGLDVAAGVALLQAEPYRIAGDVAQLQEFVEVADGHPLLLRLAASWLVALAKDRGETAEIYRLKRDDVTLLRKMAAAHRGDPAATVGKVLDESFRKLSEARRVLLVRSSVLRRRVTLGAARAMVAEVSDAGGFGGVGAAEFLGGAAAGGRVGVRVFGADSAVFGVAGAGNRRGGGCPSESDRVFSRGDRALGWDAGKLSGAVGVVPP